MRIRVAKDAVCGDVPVAAGEYWVSLRHETRQFILLAGGKNLLIPATKRRATSRSKTTVITFFTGGGTVWSLMCQDPKYGEWVAFLDYKAKGGGDRRKK